MGRESVMSIGQQWIYKMLLTESGTGFDFIYLKFDGKDIKLWSARNADEWPKIF